jgi:hypothetical protein
MPVPTEWTLTTEQYESLIKLARDGAAGDPDKLRLLEEWFRIIETANGVTRSYVKVRWQELDAPLPAGTDFPDTWPPEWERDIELVTRPVAKVDVEAVVNQNGIRPTNIMCTRDPAGILGWTELDYFFPT